MTADQPPKHPNDRPTATSRRRRRRRRRRGEAASPAAAHPTTGDAPTSANAAAHLDRNQDATAAASSDPQPALPAGARPRRRRRRGGADPSRRTATGSPPLGAGPFDATDRTSSGPSADRESEPWQPERGSATSSPPRDIAAGGEPADAAGGLVAERHFEDTSDGIRWGDDADAPTPELCLAADLPANPPAEEPDPATAHDDDGDDTAGPGLPSAPVRNLVGVKFMTAGKIYLYEATGDQDFARGEEVVVEDDRGPQLGIVAVPSVRRTHEGPIKRVLRRADEGDRRQKLRNQERAHQAVQIARASARDLGLPIKVFRAEYPHTGRRVRIYFSSEERVDFRELVRDLSRSLQARVEMRQTGVRDQAKMLGGIGSCGQELCCTTWLPEFVPVSIKNAKDQGLVLNPTKVSGQCGRLKCCLVYEQESYAELRRGLPKLGKRVITAEGEGRVVEVDVLRQRVRVSLASGESILLPGTEVQPMFPAKTKAAPPGEA